MYTHMTAATKGTHKTLTQLLCAGWGFVSLQQVQARCMLQGVVHWPV